MGKLFFLSISRFAFYKKKTFAKSSLTRSADRILFLNEKETRGQERRREEGGKRRRKKEAKKKRKKKKLGFFLDRASP